MSNVVEQVRIGCGGWSYKEWRGVLYEKGLPAAGWLPRYAEEFSTVEVNNTFYRLPTPEAVEKWIEGSPPGFLFTLKMSRYATHIKRLTQIERMTGSFLEPLKPLIEAKKTGPLLWQFPPNLRYEGENRERLESALPQLPAGRHAFEFRHESWFNREVYDQLSEHGVALVISDDPERPFQTHERTAGFTLIRFHAGRRGRGGNYSPAELEEWARRIKRWRKEIEVFAYFNNSNKEFALNNARFMRDKLGT